MRLLGMGELVLVAAETGLSLAHVVVELEKL